MPKKNEVSKKGWNFFMLKNDDASRFLLSVATKGGNVPVPFVFFENVFALAECGNCCLF